MEIAQKRPIKITTSAIVLLNILFCSIGFFIPSYALQGFIAVIALTVAIGISVHQKRITLYSFSLFAASLLFIASAVILYGYVNVVEPLPILQQFNFLKILRPQQISSGLTYIGGGIICIALFLIAKPTPFFKKNKLYALYIFIVSIVLLLIGINSVIKGSLRL